MKFQYSEYTNPDNSKIYRPTVSILFENAKKFILTEALIDSGADYTILPIELAGELGIVLDARKKKTFYGAGSNPFNVYVSPTEIECCLRQSGFRNIKWKTKVYFGESQPAILLGNKGFLDRFRIVLNGIKKEVIINRS